MEHWRRSAVVAYWGLTLLVLVLGAVLVVRAPIEPSMGPIQKLIYLHLPVAASTFLAALIVCVASVGYLGGRRKVWDDLAHAAATVTVLNGTVLLVTGVFWAKVAWGVWWTWSPRLTFSLILWMLYAVYLVLRVRIAPPRRRAMITSIYGVVAFLDVPLLYLSVKLLPDVHPTESGLNPEMHAPLWAGFAGITLVSIGLIVARFALARLRSLGWDEEPRRAAPAFVAGGTSPVSSSIDPRAR